jgi:hypothetical protein
MRVCSKGIKDVETHLVAIAEQCQQLKSISLNCDLPVASLLTMLGYLPGIEVLRTKSVLYDTVRRTLEIKASGTKVSDTDLIHLVNYPFIINDVDSVALEDCPHVSDKALAHVAKVFNSHLKHFTALQCSGITDDGIDEIFSSCNQLTDVNVSNCRKLTATACVLLSQKCAQVHTLNWSNYASFFAGKQVVKSHLSPAIITRIGDTWNNLCSVKLIGTECVSYSVLAELVTKCAALTGVETSYLDYLRDQHIHFSNCAALEVNAEVEEFVVACSAQTISDVKMTDCAHLVDGTMMSLLLGTFSATLTSVCLIGCPLLSDAILVEIVNKNCCQLRVVHVFGTISLSGAHIEGVLRHCPDLFEFQNDNVKYARDDNSLTVKGSNMSNAELHGIMMSIPLLEMVAIHCNTALTDDVVAFIVKRFASRLTSLQLKDCALLTRQCVQEIVVLSSILTRLEFLECPLIDNATIETILEHCDNLQLLQSFTLSCGVRDRQFDDHLLQFVAKCPALKYLYVTSDDNSVFNDLLVERGVRHHPKLIAYA